LPGMAESGNFFFGYLQLFLYDIYVDVMLFNDMSAFMSQEPPSMVVSTIQCSMELFEVNKTVLNEILPNRPRQRVIPSVLCIDSTIASIVFLEEYWCRSLKVSSRWALPVAFVNLVR
jgi:hypothetical protein